MKTRFQKWGKQAWRSTASYGSSGGLAFCVVRVFARLVRQGPQSGSAPLRLRWSWSGCTAHGKPHPHTTQTLTLAVQQKENNIYSISRNRVLLWQCYSATHRPGIYIAVLLRGEKNTAQKKTKNNFLFSPWIPSVKSHPSANTSSLMFRSISRVPHTLSVMYDPANMLSWMCSRRHHKRSSSAHTR